jgi:hypothetical protein
MRIVVGWVVAGLFTRRLWAGLVALWLLLPSAGGAALAAPGLCVGPVCGDEISRSAKYHWQLRLRVSDQENHRERILVDCRNGGISPQLGPVDRAYVAAVARRYCRLTWRSDAPSGAPRS